ncbi:aspartyl/asparaginyl beta-hydroxylase domain-containing protein [Sandarakinorhabdus sp.]|uniref:aspartyl/asparaginyl beta-hydroxylase domain-containing protein n=1 Tax=Sandarakinorhabdus sp. TaxID=1916663 RepID=UPI0033410FD2
MAALSRRDGATAVRAFAQATAIDPSAAVLWYNLANAHALLVDEQAQLAALETALTLDPYMAHALLARGKLHEALGQTRQALVDYQRLLAAVDPNEPVGPGFAAGLDHARQLLHSANSALAAHLDTALAQELASAAPDVKARVQHAIDAQLGRRRIYVHQPLALHYPYLPAIQFFDRALFPWFAELEAATPLIRAELQAVLAAGGDGFVPYVQYAKGVPVNQWQELNNSDAWSARFFRQHGSREAAMRALCPNTAALLDRLPLFDVPGRGPTAFFSLLKPRTVIPPHTGATNVRTIVHLPLIVPEGCWFRVGNETRPWTEGQAFAFDDTIEHEAHNPTDQLRAVLILDCWNPHIAPAERPLIARWLTELDAHGRGVASFSAA